MRFFHRSECPQLIYPQPLHRRILSYLIALRILKGLLPSEQLLSRFENVNKLYTPFIKAIKTGNLKAYDDALEAWESTLLKLSLYLIVERARELCIRGLFRKVCVLFLDIFLSSTHAH